MRDSAAAFNFVERYALPTRRAVVPLRGVTRNPFIECAFGLGVCDVSYMVDGEPVGAEYVVDGFGVFLGHDVVIEMNKLRANPRLPLWRRTMSLEEREDF